MLEFKLLQTFRGLFEGQCYLHRKSNLGDTVACALYEDLVNIGKSQKLVDRVKIPDRVVNLKNVTVGKSSRRGDGTFGELVPAAIAISEKGFVVWRGHTANIEIGVETKILAKAMIKQIDRVIGDLQGQTRHFRSSSKNAICIGIVGVNHAAVYTSFEGAREFRTDGKIYKHPIQEATEAIRRLKTLAAPAFDEFLILPFIAENVPPFIFKWNDEERTALEYPALLTRVSREYDQRF
jgi:hypothetical protein